MPSYKGTGFRVCFALIGCDRSGVCVCVCVGVRVGVCVRGGRHRPVWCGEGIPQSAPTAP